MVTEQNVQSTNAANREEMARRALALIASDLSAVEDGTVDEMTPVSIESKPLNERLKLMEKLEEKDRQTVINVIDAMLTKKKMRDLLLKQEEEVCIL
jgi:hypothetical protein